MEFKKLWDLESAMKVLEHDTVDSKLWAEAVEWLIVYGPPEIRQLLLDASFTATNSSFPELKPSHYSSDGQPVYDVQALAQTLGMSEEDIRKILTKKEAEHQIADINTPGGSSTVH